MKMGESTIAYLKARKSKLATKDCIVALLIDEIYTRKQVQYAHGKFYGNENENISKTLLCIMIKSVAGKYRDIISISPISNLTAKKQYDIWYNTALALSEIGFDIAVTMTDGNDVNRKCFKDFICQGSMKLCIDSPFNQSDDNTETQKMFLMFDPLHLFNPTWFSKIRTRGRG